MPNLTFLTSLSAIVSSDAAPLIVQPPSSAITAFGAQRQAVETPEAYLSFIYNINTALVTTATANGGTVTQASSMAVLQTSTAVNGSAQLQSNHSIRYIAGQGMLARFTALFTAGKADSQQEIGMGDAVDGFFFGYVGASFGIIHRNAGVDTFIAQADWNSDTLLGSGGSGVTIDPTKGNVYTVQLQWLGFGAIRFWVESPDTGKSILVHTIQRANAFTAVSLVNPTLPLRVKVINSGNDTNLTLRTPSMGVYREGVEAPNGLHGATYNRKTGISTETCLFAIKNGATAFSGQTNKVQARLGFLSISSTADTVFRVVRNPTQGGTPSFADFDADTSVISIDTAGTTRTGGRVEHAFVVDANAGQIIKLHDLKVYAYPGDVIAVTAASVVGSAAAQAALNWSEEF